MSNSPGSALPPPWGLTLIGALEMWLPAIWEAKKLKAIFFFLLTPPPPFRTLLDKKMSLIPWSKLRSAISRGISNLKEDAWVLVKLGRRFIPSTKGFVTLFQQTEILYLPCHQLHQFRNDKIRICPEQQQNLRLEQEEVILYEHHSTFHNTACPR